MSKQINLLLNPKILSNMKKVFLTLLVAVMSITASAQVYVGGEVGLWHNNDAEETTFTIAPEIGYQLDSKWALGIGLDYSDLGATESLSVNPYARYSAAKMGPVTFFLDGGVDLYSYKPAVGDSQTAWAIGIKPGLKVAVCDKLDFVAHCGFLGYQDSEVVGKQSGFGFNVSGKNLTFGLLYNF